MSKLMECKGCGYFKREEDMKNITEWRKDVWSHDFEPYDDHRVCRKCFSIMERDAKRKGELVKRGEEGYRAKGNVFFIEE